MGTAKNYSDWRRYIQEYYEKELLSTIDLGRKYERCLDIGCGTGNLTMKIFNILNCEKVVGIDPDLERISLAKKSFDQSNLEFICCKTMDIHPKDYKFDLAISNAVLHWISTNEKAEIFQHLSELMKPGGRIVMNCSRRIASNIQMICDIVQRETGLDVFENIFVESEKIFHEIFESSKFKVISFENVDFDIEVNIELDEYLDLLSSTISGMADLKMFYHNFEDELKLLKTPNGNFLHDGKYYQFVLEKM